MVSASIHGYYRWTDINFEWYKTIKDPAEQSALRAFLSPDCLISPENPLYNHEEGCFDLYLGTRSDGEQRLLYTTAQIEYIRYWLYTMGLTKQMISIPNSSYVLTNQDFSAISKQTYKETKALKDAQKTLHKNNKRLKGVGDMSLVTIRKQFECIRAAYQAKSGTWLAMDFEAWERDHTLLTEFGYSQLTWENGQEVIIDGHSVPRQHQGYRNGQFVVDQRHNFQYGDTRTIPLAQWNAEISDMISSAAARGPLFLVFHDANNDLRSLKHVGTPLEDLKTELPDKPPETGLFVIDTAIVFNALCGDSQGQRRGLQRMCEMLGLSHFIYYHNAGNDAHFTLAALQSMASGAPLDAQREARWATTSYIDQENKVKVNLPESGSEESEYDSETDDDGIQGWLGPKRAKLSTDAPSS